MSIMVNRKYNEILLLIRVCENYLARTKEKGKTKISFAIERRLAKQLRAINEIVILEKTKIFNKIDDDFAEVDGDKYVVFDKAGRVACKKGKSSERFNTRADADFKYTHETSFDIEPILPLLTKSEIPDDLTWEEIDGFSGIIIESGIE